MAFNLNKDKQRLYKEAEEYLIAGIDESEKQRSLNKLKEIINDYGPVVDYYPSWHPLIASHTSSSSQRIPDSRCGYRGLDHTRYFRNAFITCPYTNGKEVLDSIKKLSHYSSIITTELLSEQFYSPDVTPILVCCEWHTLLGSDGMIPASLAIPLILEQELPCWKGLGEAKTWEEVRSDFLGLPHNTQSSLFISQETGSAMKKIWNLLINTGMFGDINYS